jgi:hypothetical protein
MRNGDDTHLYNKFIGKLSIVVGFDMNNGIFSFGVALVEKETKYN